MNEGPSIQDELWWEWRGVELVGDVQGILGPGNRVVCHGQGQLPPTTSITLASQRQESAPLPCHTTGIVVE